MTLELKDNGPVLVSNPQKGIAVITVNRPERRNALNLEVKNLIADAIEGADNDDAIQVIVLTGANNVFVAGTDLAEMAKMVPSDHIYLKTDRIFNVLTDSSKILIAAVEGYALGGGCELALGCDMIVAGHSALFGQPEILVGIMPGAGGSQRLLRTIGKYQTMKMILTGEPITASEGLASGLVSEAVEDGGALERAVSMGKKITRMPPLAVSAIKEVVRLGQDVPLETALKLERKAFQLLFDSEDQKEGMNAFLEKRKPAYHGR